MITKLILIMINMEEETEKLLTVLIYILKVLKSGCLAQKIRYQKIHKLCINFSFLLFITGEGGTHTTSKSKINENELFTTKFHPNYFYRICPSLTKDSKNPTLHWKMLKLEPRSWNTKKKKNPTKCNQKHHHRYYHRLLL